MTPKLDSHRFAIIVPHRDGTDLLRSTLSAALLADSGADVIVVVDNASTDGSPELLANEFPAVRWIRNDRNRGFAAACNQGARLVRSRYLLFLNSDAALPPHALDRLVEFFERTPRAGEVGCRLVGPDGRPQRATAPAPDLLSESGLRKRVPRGFCDPSAVSQVGVLVGACVAMPRAVFERVQGWDEDFFFYEEDTDLSVRVREAGHDVWYLSDLEIVHGRGVATRGVRLPAQLEAVRSRFTYICKHFPPIVASLLCCARVLSILFATTGALAGVLATFGLVRGLRTRASRSLVTLLWVMLLMRPRWSLSGRA